MSVRSPEFNLFETFLNKTKQDFQPECFDSWSAPGRGCLPRLATAVFDKPIGIIASNLSPTIMSCSYTEASSELSLVPPTTTTDLGFSYG